MNIPAPDVGHGHGTVVVCRPARWIQIQRLNIMKSQKEYNSDIFLAISLDQIASEKYGLPYHSLPVDGAEQDFVQAEYARLVKERPAMSSADHNAHLNGRWS